MQPTQAAFDSETTSSFFSQLATKIGINADKVAVAVNQIHQEHMQEREAEAISQLDAAVANGTITKSQKQAIFTHHQKMQDEHQNKWEDMKDMNRKERKEEHEKEQAEHKAWAQSVGLDLKTIHRILGGGGERGHKHNMDSMRFGR